MGKEEREKSRKIRINHCSNNIDCIVFLRGCLRMFVMAACSAASRVFRGTKHSHTIMFHTAPIPRLHSTPLPCISHPSIQSDSIHIHTHTAAASSDLRHGQDRGILCFIVCVAFGIARRRERRRQRCDSGAIDIEIAALTMKKHAMIPKSIFHFFTLTGDGSRLRQLLSRAQ